MAHISEITRLASEQLPTASRKLWQWAILWLAVRVATSACAAWASALRPLTLLEQSVSLWPPAAPLGEWLQRVLLSPWERWDVIWYLRILNDGYRFGNGTDAFHPLYSWLAYPLTLLGINSLLALLLVTSAAFVVFIYVFERLAALDLSPAQVEIASILLFFFPLTFIFFAPYNESVFMLLTALLLWWARQRRWWWAGIAGLLAVLVRQQGVLLVVPLAWELWEAHERQLRQLLRGWRNVLAVGLIPCGLLLWTLYRSLVIGGEQLDFSSPVALGYSMIISPSAGQVGAAHVITWPWQAMGLALTHLWRAPDVDIIVNLVLGIAFLVATLLAWPRLRAAYRWYVLIVTVISFSYHTGSAHPYMGLPRHLYLAFPVFIGLAPVVQRSWQRLLLIGSGFMSICFLTLLYVLESWVP